MTNNQSERVSKLNNFAYSLLTHSDVVQQNWALLFPNYRPGQTEISDERLTYSEFAARVGVVQSKFEQLGFKPKDRVVVMFAPSVELYVLLTALFASNIAAVFIDPGFSLRRIAHCIQESNPTAVIGVKKVGILRVLFSGLRRIPFYGVDGEIWGLVRNWKLVQSDVNAAAVIAPCEVDDHCIITFTSGSTGNNKAADRSHGLLMRQTAIFDQTIPKSKFSSGMSTFPVSAFLAFSRGDVFCVPAIDFRRQADANPTLIARQVMSDRIEGIAASPAFYEALCRYPNPEDFSSIRYCLVGGAAVSQKLVARMMAFFKNAEINVVYGSTEIDPVSLIPAANYIKQVDLGINVGKPISEINWVVINPGRLDQELKSGSPLSLVSIQVSAGEIGELLVWGPHVMDRYMTTESEVGIKVTDRDGVRWHRMGDMGFVNENGDWILVGRRNDQVTIDWKSWYPFPIEQPVNNLPGVARSALCSGKNNRPRLVVQLDTGAIFSGIEPLIREILKSFGLDIPIVQMRLIPVDSRHNSRVDRTALRRLA